MADESDGIEEAIEGQVRMLTTAAAQAGERIARMREQQRREAQASSEREARDLSARLDAERQTARTSLAGVHRTDWWDDAQPEQIARAYETAVAWSHKDPEAARAEQRITDELHTRYGATPDEFRGRAARAESRQSYREADQERVEERDDSAEAARLMGRAGREEDRAQDEPAETPESEAVAESEHHRDVAEETRGDAHAAYDSAERRSQTAAALDAQGHDRETIATRMQADVSQGKPATYAPEGAGGSRAAKARKTSGRAATAERSRQGLSR